MFDKRYIAFGRSCVNARTNHSTTTRRHERLGEMHCSENTSSRPFARSFFDFWANVINFIATAFLSYLEACGVLAWWRQLADSVHLSFVNVKWQIHHWRFLAAKFERSKACMGISFAAFVLLAPCERERDRFNVFKTWSLPRLNVGLSRHIYKCKYRLCIIVV